MRIALVALLLLAGAEQALAAKDPCEKFRDADAYNNCLAGFGPVAGSHKLTQPPPAENFSHAGRKRSARPKPPVKQEAPAPREAKVTHKANGRVRIELLVQPGR